MKRLILLRHAKSDWSAPALSDHERPLNKRGRGAAALMSTWLTGRGMAPDLALVSSAVRAQETWARMGMGADKLTLPRLYNASPETILDAARGADEAAGTVMIIAHQPGIQAAANLFLADGVIENYPTAKATVLGFDAPSWFEVGFGEGRLIAEMEPRELS